MKGSNGNTIHLSVLRSKLKTFRSVTFENETIYTRKTKYKESNPVYIAGSGGGGDTTLSTRQINKSSSFFLTANKNGLSSKISGLRLTLTDLAIVTAVAAAATVPSSVHSMLALCSTSLIIVADASVSWLKAPFS